MIRYCFIHRFNVLLLCIGIWWIHTATATSTIKKAEVFARFIPEQETLLAEDSCVVSVVLYATHPFVQIKELSKPLKIKGGHFRELPFHNKGVQEYVKLPEGFFYRTTWKMMMVGREDIGVIRFSKMEFSVLLDASPSKNTFWEDFFYEDSEYYKPVERKCKLASFQLPVLARPRKTTREMLKRGAILI